MGRSGKKSGGGFFTTLRRLFMLIFLLLIAFVGTCYWYKDQLRVAARARILFKAANVRIDLGGLLQNRCRGSLDLLVTNRLPFGLTLQNLTYDLSINGIDVGSGIQLQPKATIGALATTPVPISFSIDAAKTTLALAKTAPDAALAVADSVLDQLRGKRRHPPSLGNLTRLTGTADFRFLAGSFELPIDQTAAFAKSY